MTVTQALAEIKTIPKRIDKKHTAILRHLAYDARLKDPISQAGGSGLYVQRELQSIRDLELRLIDLRLAVQKSNLTSVIKVGRRELSVAGWLAWKKDVSESMRQRLHSMSLHIEGARRNMDATVNMDETLLTAEIEELERIMGELDGLLTMHNSRVDIGM